jgi:hypothetical protein
MTGLGLAIILSLAVWSLPPMHAHAAGSPIAARRVVTPGALLFIPRDKWVGLENTGQETMRVAFIFSALGYDRYLWATSVPEGEAVVPFTPRELAEVRQKYRPYITFKEE